MRIVVKPPPADTSLVEEALRRRHAFIVENTDVSGWHSSFRKHCFVMQAGGSIVAIYDKDADLWFVRNDATVKELAWAYELVRRALSGIKTTEVSYKELKNIHRYGYVELVRKRLNLEEK